MGDKSEIQLDSKEHKYLTKDHIIFGFGYFMDNFLTGTF